VQDAREDEARALVREADALRLVELVGDGGLQLDAELPGHDRLLAQVEGLGREVDVARVRRVPEMIVRRRDDLVERVGPVGIPIDLDQGVEVVAVDRVVDLVVRDVSFDHGDGTPLGFRERPLRRSDADGFGDAGEGTAFERAERATGSESESDSEWTSE
jgi:hypothetical protein